MDQPRPVYALNLFDISSKEEYIAYSRRSGKEVLAHGGKLIALGSFKEAEAGDISPRQVMVLVEWPSMNHFKSYVNDPALAGLHPHREKGTEHYIWHLFEKLEDLRLLLK